VISAQLIDQWAIDQWAKESSRNRVVAQPCELDATLSRVLRIPRQLRLSCAAKTIAIGVPPETDVWTKPTRSSVMSVQTSFTLD